MKLPCGRPSPRERARLSEKQLSSWQKRLRAYLATRGLKYTEQRWKIAELVLGGGEHLDAQQVVDRVRARYPEIGAATVYRNIKVLRDAEILKESFNDVKGKVVYELFEDDHHDHIVCSDCGAIFEFHDDRIESLQNRLASKLAFRETKHRHVIYAACEFKSQSSPR